MIWFEDMPIGERSDLGARRFSASEIAAFAKRYDARPEQIAGKIASGWHIVAVWMQTMMGARDAMPPPPAGDRVPMLGPSPGFLNLTWPHPVRAGDLIRYSTEVVEKIPLKSRPQWGIVRNRNEARNEKGDLVMQFTGQALFERRNPGSAP